MLATTGIGTGRLYRLVMWLAVPVALVTVWLSVFLYPSISYVAHRIKLEQQDAVLVAAMDAGRFIESNRGDMVLYAEARGDKKSSLEHLFVHNREEGKLAIATAAAGRHRLDADSGLRVVTLDEGMRYEGRFKDPAMTVMEFGAYDMWVNPVSTEALDRKYSTWSTAALWGAKEIKARAELQKRLSHPFTLLAFTLLAVPLSRSMPRQGVHGRIVSAIFVYLVAVGLGEVAATWMVKGVTPTWLGTWWVPALMFGFGLFLAAFEAAPRFRPQRSRAG